MHIISGGHQLGGGAYGIVSETDEDRKVVSEILKLDNSIKDVSINYPIDADNELVQKVNKVNELCRMNNVDCYSDIHFNAFNGQANGVECIILGFDSGLYASKESYEDNYNKAKKVCESISKSLGIVNRGVKTNNQFYVLRKTNCHSIIIEVCFLDNVGDMAKYNDIRAAKAIYTSLTGIDIPKEEITVKEEILMDNCICYCNEVDEKSARVLGVILGWDVLDARISKNWKAVSKNIVAVGGDNPRKGEPSQYGFSGYTKTYIKGINREDTLAKCLEFAKSI